MNSIEFYSKLQQYKDKNTLSHAGIPASYKKLATGLNNMKNYGYYNKIDNFYGPGKSRYFYSKDEWDAYQREKNRIYDKAKADAKARNEAAEAARPKSNVEQAQYARQQAEKKGQRETQRQQEKGITKRTINSSKVVDDILDTISVYSHNNEIKHKVDKLREKYDIYALGYGDGPTGYHQDEEYRKLMDPYVKGDKNILPEDNINSDNDFNRMRQIEHEYSQKYYKDLMNDVKDIVRSDPKNAEWIMYQLMSRSSVKNAMNNNNEVYDVITKALRDLNMDNAETWDNSKNIKSKFSEQSWDKIESETAKLNKKSK